MPIILHITTRERWQAAQSAGSYTPEGFAAEGFIHCSTRDQVARVANARFRGQTGLVLLCVETDGLSPELRYENLEGGDELFPHIYGPLSLNAVVDVLEFEPEGLQFSLPAQLVENV